ncbi:PREDICTED: uncharacterized protein LOC105972765 [Erythranthe guttata]|uniref:uncharacterized protein LOC105972765 n=1 Tax=Erythranthe guttata TaxID=4155 RepID=UPI00064E0E59|nr:PREDICTED: uncharacterized protein LOC105972765 [Erythranthe guttata]|eukprot:XP_012853199.1 PREDICTED: uncharacterized protein LOC105972765 [Erythranthe guttata]
MFKFKASFSITDSAFDSMMQMIRDMLPDDNTLPESFYLTKKIFKTLELRYEKIHACANDCCLFRNDLEHATKCPKCGASRWKVSKNETGIKNGVPTKVLRYFPVIPRLRRMFAIGEIAEQVRWHSTNKSIDGKLRHPVDSLAWDSINRRWPSFASDPHNMRFGLSTDGFNPFQDRSSYSCWPVILASYNLPPWLCMSKESLMLTLLIPGPRQPSNDIDIYLAPLIDDMKLLWKDGIEIGYHIVASLPIWDIDDFLLQITDCASKKCLLVRHNVDVIHVEKNVCESIFGTLLNQKGKTKDGLKSRKDLEEMQIRRDLHPQKRGNRLYLPTTPHTLSKTEKQFFCRRLYNLKLPDGYGSNIANCVSLADCKLIGLKSHDCHVLMQQLSVVALKDLLSKAPRTAVFRLCVFFNELCQKVVDRNKLEKLEEEIVETLCMLERFFPPSFFDIMIHLTIDLGREARLCGPVQYRWMYPFERYMKVIKGYVKSRARPEGCIAERYIVEECALLCSKYIKKADDIGSRNARNEEFESSLLLEGRPISKGHPIDLSFELLQVAHRYVLFNVEDV